MTHQELNEFRQKFHDFSIADRSDIQLTPEDQLMKSMFSVDEKGNIVNFFLSPPDKVINKEQFTDLVLSINQNKILNV